MSALPIPPDPACPSAMPKSPPPGRDPFAADQGGLDTQIDIVGSEPSETSDRNRPGSQHRPVAGLDSPPTGPSESSEPNARADRLEDALLAIYADALDDIEKTRISTENRIRALIQVKGLADSPEEKRLRAVAAELKALEHRVELDLRRAMRAHPIGPWVKAQQGVGDKQAGRLLAAIGDPYIKWDTGQPRTVSQLWALCGYHVLPAQGYSANQLPAGGEDSSSSDPSQVMCDTRTQPAGVAARRRKGQKANWNSTAKMRAYLVAESCMKQPGSRYRDIYLQRRAHTAITHPDWTDGHSHTDGLRILAKQLLKDLWIEGRRLHEFFPEVTR